MDATAAPLALIPAAEKLVQAVSNDIVVIDTKWYRKKKIGKETVLVPIDVQLHMNPVSIGIGAAGLALAGGLAYLAWEGLPFTSGLKDSEYWQGLVGKVTRHRTEPQRQSALDLCLAGCAAFTDPIQRFACQAACRARIRTSAFTVHSSYRNQAQTQK